MLKALLMKLAPGPPAEGRTEARLGGLAERIHLMLREAGDLLSDDASWEPGCAMLLLLYCAGARGEAVTVTGLGSAMGLPHATAARRISALSKAGLIELRPDEADRRRRFVALTRTGLETVGSWLELVDGARLSGAGVGGPA